MKTEEYSISVLYKADQAREIRWKWTIHLIVDGELYPKLSVLYYGHTWTKWGARWSAKRQARKHTKKLNADLKNQTYSYSVKVK